MGLWLPADGDKKDPSAEEYVRQLEEELMRLRLGEDLNADKVHEADDRGGAEVRSLCHADIRMKLVNMTV